MSKTLVTHNSSFHADDIFAVAVLLLVEPDLKVVRTRDKEAIASADYVVDVGFEHDPHRQRFDHHQPGGAGERENGIPYASFGLVWKAYGEKLAGGGREAEVIDRILVQGMDAHDNGVAIADYRYDDVSEYTLRSFFYSYLTDIRETEEELYEIFMKVVDIARDLLVREIKRAKKIIESEDAVRKIYEESEDKRIIVLDEEYDWVNTLMDTPDAIFAIYPRRDGHWSVKGVPASKKTYGLRRKDFPASWGGKQGEELVAVTGVPDAMFAHRGLFMVAAKTKEGARALAELALKA